MEMIKADIRDYESNQRVGNIYAKLSNKIYTTAKRCTDIILSLMALLVLLPVCLIISIAIFLEDGGPVFYHQERIGKDETVFRMYKFRSMKKNADQLHNHIKQIYQISDVSFKRKDDPRITRVGKFIRKTGMDELPQLLNVLRGEMSIVGPRPLPLYEYEQVKEQYKARYSVPQGLTCYWQVSDRSHIDFDTRMKMDERYASESSFKQDMLLIVQTFGVVLTGKGEY